MTENYIEMLDECYLCDKKESCDTMQALYDIIKNSPLIQIAIQECAKDE